MSVAFAQVVLRDIDEATARLAGYLADGAASDWTSYQAMVAERRGLLKAREFVTERFSDEERDSFQLR